MTVKNNANYWPGTERILMGVKEVADYLGLHPNTIYAWIKAGDIEITRLGRKILFTWSQVRDYLDANRMRFSVNDDITSYL